MENTIAKDYVTEKLYDGLVAGCVPIYLGAPNIYDYIPHNSSIVDYQQLGSPERLMEELEHLASNRAAYEAKLAWKTWDSSRWNPGESSLVC